MRWSSRVACTAVCLASLGSPAAGPAVATGAWHSLALHADGTLRSWGDDSAGALGIGRPLVTAAPVAVNGLTGVVAVAAGGNHSVALKSDGTVWGWGSNEAGELGDGTTTARSLPVQAIGLAGVVQIAAGRSHIVARTSDGRVWTWGSNYVGELGALTDARSTPAPVSAMSGVVEIAAGASHTLARKSDGTVWAWGENDYGQLGDGAPTEPYTGRFEPVRVVGLADVVQISAGGRHTLARKSDGTVWAWGDNSGGQVGDGTTILRASPVQVSGLGGVVEVSAGYFYNLARKGDGTIWAWGAGGYGQLGDGLYEDRLTPIRLGELSGVTQMAAGFLHSVAVREDGGLWAWGANGNGQLGDGTTVTHQTPFQVPGLGGLQAAAVGGFHTVALRRDGTVLTWGDNSLGQLGNGAYTFRAAPVVVGGLSNVAAIAGSGYHSLALTADGRVFAWGTNIANQFGDDSVGHSSPTQIAGLANVTAITAGYFHSVALLADGNLRSWGSNYNGLLGTGTDDGIAGVVPVSALFGVTQVSAGGSHTLALKNDGTVWAWGENGSGELGDGTTTHRFAPVQVQGLANVVEVAAGPAHSLARTRDGSILAWGRNIEGQLGDGTDVGRSTPGRVVGLTNATALAAGRDFSLALAGGKVWAWGTNYNGGIGCPGCDGRLVPLQLPGVDRISKISAFQFHVLALRDDGTVLSWGGGKLGQLGDGTLVDRETPVMVLHEGGTGSLAGNDWFLDLDPARPKDIPADRIPVFLVLASSAANGIVADIHYRPQDVGSSASTFVFALAPATVVRGAVAKDARFSWKARGAPKDAPVPCALAQLNASGQLVAVSAASLQAYVSGVLSAQGQSVNILNSVNSGNVAGATFYVGYGPNGNAMLINGTTKSVVSVPGNVSCRPQAPQAGWWYNAAEGGRGYSIEARGNRLFFAAFHYDQSGRATWNFAGGATSLDGSLFTSDFLGASGGQTLTGPYRLPGLTPAGAITLAFSDATHGTMAWPGGTVAIERQAFVPGGLTAPAQANLPESGWWWNPQESGRGFFIEWQNGYADLAGYMYDDAGNPTWYISVVATPNPMLFSGNWWSFAGGQSMGGPYRPATRTNDNVGPVTLEFSGPATATMTLPGGRRIALVRQAF